ncbi:DNA replication protein [Klebsiella oxytoca]|uniref:DNA replication protein n=1 Tax=Klebsiella oxytoca TaxID=571 RepID=A0AAD3YNV6_KLEOX|nr:DNA replication protein [Klebsiella oxytoca]ELT9975870.1 DNA replication protein [Klebsiella oxytoca]MBL6084049.1 DNA replication protein [Klebsiella oxytoca]MBL6248352.1 DNA replication protein [Klebsiella oxytoca]MBL6270970.1 DNA replication protein [Klebsiella oxytoca]
MGVVKLSDYRLEQRPTSNNGAASMGFVYLHRQFMDSKLYKDSQAVHLWLHLILKANHAETAVMTDIGEMVVGRGQMITGRPTLVSETFIPDNKVRSLLRTFETKGMIKIESKERKFSLVTICKYDDFQTQNCPTNVQRLSNANTSNEAPLSVDCPTNVQLLSINNNINNNSLTNVRESASADKGQAEKKPKISCEEVFQALREELPEARGWKFIDDRRRNLIRSFWAKANKIARGLDDGQALTIEGFRDYLKYIRVNCRWMLEDRADTKSGKTWRRKNYEAFLSDKLYLEVREGDRDDF